MRARRPAAPLAVAARLAAVALGASAARAAPAPAWTPPAAPPPAGEARVALIAAGPAAAPAADGLARALHQSGFDVLRLDAPSPAALRAGLAQLRARAPAPAVALVAVDGPRAPLRPVDRALRRAGADVALAVAARPPAGQPPALARGPVGWALHPGAPGAALDALAAALGACAPVAALLPAAAGPGAGAHVRLPPAGDALRLGAACPPPGPGLRLLNPAAATGLAPWDLPEAPVGARLLGPPQIAGARPPDGVTAALEALLPAIGACAEAEAPVELRLRLVVGPEGGVRSAEVLGASAAVAGCVDRVVRRARFPAEQGCGVAVVGVGVGA
jgi:hypothetical protein